ncbi:MAG: PH domain-containing protein [Pseudolysinimonas sp.]|uniref:PH domain-containing protein n=1 Tax=Pseudolysinimonas sp. TaxID=2680009 RepID=UPI003C78F93D
MTTPEAETAGPIDPVPGDWQRVSPKYVVVDLLGILVSAIIFTVGASIPAIVSGVAWLVALPIFMFVLHAVIAAFTPRRVRALGYRLRVDDLVFRKGIMFLRVVAVPYGRMQLVDINRGPIARAFGLSELKLVTAAASSHVTIPGLPEADAEILRDRLVELAESRRAGL